MADLAPIALVIAVLAGIALAWPNQPPACPFSTITMSGDWHATAYTMGDGSQEIVGQPWLGTEYFPAEE